MTAKELRSIALRVALLLVAGSPTQAATTEIFGQGLQSCGTWTESRTGAPANRVGPTSAALSSLGMTSWAMGYLSGGAAALGVDYLKTSDFDGMTLWLDSFCKTYPLKSFAAAVGALQIELIKRTRADKP